MSRFRCVPLGIGDAFSTRWYSSCLALEADGNWLLIDCPHPIRKMMSEAAAAAAVDLDIDRVSAIALTHLHVDHMSGLEGFAFYSRFMLQRPVRLLAHPSVSEDLWAGRLAAGMKWVVQARGAAPVERSFEHFFELLSLSETTPVMVGPFAVRCRPTVHSVPTTALYIEAGGRRLGYSADTEFDPELIAWLSTADLIIHEANGGFMHTPYDALATLPDDVRAKLRLLHCPDDFDPRGRELERLQEGRVYDV